MTGLWTLLCKKDPDPETPPPRKNQAPDRFMHWIQLILINWVLLFFIGFFSLTLGMLLIGLLIMELNLILGVYGIRYPGLKMTPPLGWLSQLILWVSCAALFLYCFKKIKYDCRAGHYRIPEHKTLFINIARVSGAAALLILIAALFIGFMN